MSGCSPAPLLLHGPSQLAKVPHPWLPGQVSSLPPAPNWLGHPLPAPRRAPPLALAPALPFGTVPQVRWAFGPGYRSGTAAGCSMAASIIPQHQTGGMREVSLQVCSAATEKLRFTSFDGKKTPKDGEEWEVVLPGRG